MQACDIPRPEYPRPDFVREEWLCLNGEWEFCFDNNEEGITEKWYNGRPFVDRVTVPFCYQSEAGGVKEITPRCEVMWYARNFSVPKVYRNRHIHLNFGAVDYHADVWVNSIYVGGHSGGYTPFALDITSALCGDGDCRLVVRVEDRHDPIQPRGKQSWKERPFGCWYTPVSGIWQSVWLEPVGKVFLQEARITPDIDTGRVHFQVRMGGCSVRCRLELRIFFRESGGNVQDVYSASHEILDDSHLARLTTDLTDSRNIDSIRYWTPEQPHLYDVEMRLYCENEAVDSVCCYFGMRKVDTQGGRFRLNNVPYYQKLVLDQGYWPNTLLTPPSDEAIRRDIELTKQMGFNGVRKHQKIEDPRYYYWADRLGLLVWGELPSNYEYCAEGAKALMDTAVEFIRRDYNHPSIVFWVPLNESWGVRNIGVNKAQQNFAMMLYHLFYAMDGTRAVSSNDGWEQVKSDICGIHDYTGFTRELDSDYADIESLQAPNGKRMLYADSYKYEGQPVMITEYGGIAFAADSIGDKWGYNGSVENETQFLRRYEDITSGFRALPYVQGYCYTQLTDVFQEVNGLLDMAREPKVSLEQIRHINGERQNVI